jgi:hypothetical protein
MRLKLVHALFDGVQIDLRRTLAGEEERLAIVGERHAGVAVLIETCRKVEGQVGIAGVFGKSSEVFLRGFGPARIGRIDACQRGM